MKGTITNVVIDEEQQIGQVVGPGNFSAFINLKKILRKVTRLLFGLSMTLRARMTLRPALVTRVVITFEDIDEGNQLVSAWQFEPLVLEEGQVAQIGFVQTAGLPKDFGYRNTNIATAQ